MKKRRYGDLTERCLESKKIYDGVILHVCRDKVLLPDGREGVREVLRHCRAVCVIPIDEEERVITVSQYRYAHEQVLLEIPAGKIDRQEESFLDAAKRELREETGATADEWTFLGEIYTTPAFVDEVIYMYMARGLHFGVQELDDDEFLSVERIPLTILKEMTLNGEIKDAKTQVAVLKASLMMEKERMKDGKKQ